MKIYTVENQESGYRDVTNGDPADCKDTHGLSRYNPKIVPFEGGKYLISHELYNKPDSPQKDSRKPLLDYLVSHGMSLELIFKLCQGK